MAYATGRCMCHAMMRAPFEAADVTAMVDKRVQGPRRVPRRQRRNSRPACRCISLAATPRDCRRRASKRGAAGSCWRPTSPTSTRISISGRVFPITYNVADVLAGYDKVEALATSKQHVVPGHDPIVLDIYPAARPEHGRLGRAARRRSEDLPQPRRLDVSMTARRRRLSDFNKLKNQEETRMKKIIACHRASARWRW